MKSGLIVYLAGGAELPEGFDLAGCCKEIGFPADRVELVGSRQGFFEVNDAWHFLFTKGYGDIKLLVAANGTQLFAAHAPFGATERLRRDDHEGACNLPRRKLDIFLSLP